MRLLLLKDCFSLTKNDGVLSVYIIGFKALLIGTISTVSHECTFSEGRNKYELDVIHNTNDRIIEVL